MGFTPRPRRITMQVVATGQPAHWEAACWEYSYVDDSHFVIVPPSILSVPANVRGTGLGETLRHAVDAGPVVAEAFARRFLPPAPGRATWVDFG